MSDYNKDILDEELILAHASLSFFVVGIVANIVGQIFSIEANDIAVSKARSKLYSEREEHFQKIEIEDKKLSTEDLENLLLRNKRLSDLSEAEIKRKFKKEQHYNSGSSLFTIGE